MNSFHRLADNLAQAFLASEWTLEALVKRGGTACAKRGRWLRPLVRRMMAFFADRPYTFNALALARFLKADQEFHRAWREHDLTIGKHFAGMWPAPGVPSTWTVPPLATHAAVAAWLGLEQGELEWFADCQGREAKVPPGPLRHYTYHWLAKPSGKSRLLEVPKARLKAIQRRILHQVLAHIPPHEAAHGFRQGRSIGSYAAPHVGQRIVLRMDLRHFFPSVGAGRVNALFRTAGYPPRVASLLTGLCTNVVPYDILAQPGWKGDRQLERQIFLSPHLPQGAPTSPALANLCAYRLDCRLAALAEKVGARYTRYADDLAFSGGRELERNARRFQVAVGCIALDEGFALNTRKSRFMRQALRQQLAGIVVNVRPNINRAEYDRLKATLHNCICHGVALQNRADHADFQAHLQGKIAYVEQINPARGQRLRSLFNQIRWEVPE